MLWLGSDETYIKKTCPLVKNEDRPVLAFLILFTYITFSLHILPPAKHIPFRGRSHGIDRSPS